MQKLLEYFAQQTIGMQGRWEGWERWSHGLYWEPTEIWMWRSIRDANPRAYEDTLTIIQNMSMARRLLIFYLIMIERKIWQLGRWHFYGANTPIVNIKILQLDRDWLWKFIDYLAILIGCWESTCLSLLRLSCQRYLRRSWLWSWVIFSEGNRLLPHCWDPYCGLCGWYYDLCNHSSTAFASSSDEIAESRFSSNL